MYQALYRKYRPIVFKDVVGQKSIVKVLQNSILNQHIGHAYMFFGPRGTGKTSLAKIFARTINCQSLSGGEICQKCDSCKEMLSTNCVDIIEIDAASNNGVDEIRELKSKINLVPAQLKYKVYIIDEVHMLSIGAFNALLKTLEEPPEHIVFILATTDPQKVPETIKSRCQCFNFKRISHNDIVQKLTEICQKEKKNVDEEVLKNIAISSNGGLRDSIGMLDMLCSTYNQKITMKEYVEINDLIEDEEIQTILTEIFEAKTNDLLAHIEKINNSGKNLLSISDLILQKCRDSIVNYYRNKEKLEFSLDLLEDFAFMLNEKNYDFKRAANPKIYFEMLLLKFINDHIKIEKEPKIISREIIIEQKFDKKTEQEVKTEDLNEKKERETFSEKDSYDKIEKDYLDEYHKIMDIRVNNTLCKAEKELLNTTKEKFQLLSEYVFDQEIGYLVCELMDGTVRAVSPENIVISFEYDSMIDTNIKNIDLLQKTMEKITNLDQKLAFITDEEWNQQRKKYIQLLKTGKNYTYIDEPSLPVIPKIEKKESILNHAQKLFGDIVEEE